MMTRYIEVPFVQEIAGQVETFLSYLSFSQELSKCNRSITLSNALSQKPPFTLQVTFIFHLTLSLFVKATVR